MRRSAALLAAPLVLVAGLVAPAGSAVADRTPARSSSAYEIPADRGDLERQVLTLTNRQRSRHGCGDLHRNAALTRAARRHTAQMASIEDLTHQLLGELDLVGRILKAGYHPWRRVAENVAVNYPTPRAVMRAWMHSPGHRANILDCRLHDLGVGVVDSASGMWWTQDFGHH